MAAVIVALVAVAAIGTVSDRSTTNGADTDRAGTDSQADGDSQAGDTWDPRLEPYVSFVETTRGLEFAHTVVVRQTDVSDALRASDELDLELTDDDAGDAAEVYVDIEATAFTILGFYQSAAAAAELDEPSGDPNEPSLDDGATGLETESADVRAESAAAFYDTFSGEIIIPPGEIDPWLASVIVHELTHALQDQHGLLDYAPWTADESSMQLALIEGDADRIENAWIEAQDLATQQAVYAVYEQHDSPQSSTFLDVLFATPYVLGDPAVEHIVATGGQQALDELMRNGAGSSEMLIDPLSSSPVPAEAKKRLVSDPEEGEVLGGGTLGPVLLYQLLAPKIGVRSALEAVEGYDTDDYIVYERSLITCMDVVVWTDSSEDSDELIAALDQVGVPATAAMRGVPAAESVLFKPCDDRPITSAEEQDLDLLAPLSTNSWIALEYRIAGPDVARCVGFLTAERTASAPSDLLWSDYRSVADRARLECSE